MAETPSAPAELSSPHTPATYDPGTSCKTIKLINLFRGIIYLHLTPTLASLASLAYKKGSKEIEAH